ncbi:MAG: DNA polymerase III subunit delta [Defluviitaleaceae bacterium]|nr:DNA polymerase III subunit delta [Defluviitaleaceae bacterium]
MQALKTDLKTKNFKRVYLFFGEEYFKKYYANLFKQAMIDPVSEDMNFAKYEGSVPLATLVDTAQTVPFFSERRLIIAKKTGLFAAGAKADGASLATIPPTSTLIFVEENVDKRTRLYKELAKIGYAADFVIPKESELINWVVAYFKKHKKQISTSTAKYFLQSVVHDMNTIVMEMGKLAAYCDEEVTQKHIDLLTTKSAETKIFDMLKAVGKKDLNHALVIYNNMIQAKTEPLMILAMLARQFRLILRTKALAAQGKTGEQIAKELAVQTFVVKECLLQGKNFKYNALIDALEQCLITDINIKTGKTESVLGVEMILVKFGV